MDRRKLLAAYLIWRAAKKGRAHPLGALLGAVLIHIFR